MCFGFFASDAEVQASEDYQRLLAMPSELRAELAGYFEGAFILGTVGDRCEKGLPCLWLDEVSGRCKHYEWRPQICRDFLPGTPACHNWRGEFGLPGLPLHVPDPDCD
jgi:Fe-S-cluster containining protein